MSEKEETKPTKLKPVPGKDQTPEEFEKEELSKEQYKGITLKNVLDESTDEWNSADGSVVIDTKALRDSPEFKAMYEDESDKKDAPKEGEPVADAKEKVEEGGAVSELTVELEVSKEISELVVEEEKKDSSEPVVTSFPNVAFKVQEVDITNKVELIEQGPFLMFASMPNREFVNDYLRKDEMYKPKYVEYYRFMQQFRAVMKPKMLARHAEGFNSVELHNTSHLMSSAQKEAISELDYEVTTPDYNFRAMIARNPASLYRRGQNNNIPISPYNGSVTKPKTYQTLDYFAGNATKAKNGYQKYGVDEEYSQQNGDSFDRKTVHLGVSSLNVNDRGRLPIDVLTHTINVDPYRVALIADSIKAYEFLFLTPAQFFNLPVVSPLLRRVLKPRVGTDQLDVLSDQRLKLRKFPRFMFEVEDPNCGYYYRTHQWNYRMTPIYKRSFYNRSLTAASAVFSGVAAGQLVMPQMRSTVHKTTDSVASTLFSVSSSSAKVYVQELGRFLVGGFDRRLDVDFQVPEADKVPHVLLPLSCVSHLCLLDLRLVDPSTTIQLVAGMLSPFLAVSRAQVPGNPTYNGPEDFAAQIVNRLPNLRQLGVDIAACLKPDILNRGGMRARQGPNAISVGLANILYTFLGPNPIRYTQQLGPPSIYTFDVNNLLAPFCPQALVQMQNQRSVMLFGTQDVNVETYRPDAVAQAQPLMMYLQQLAKLSSVGDIPTVVDTLIQNNTAHARSNLIFSKLIIRGSENPECVPFRQRAPVGMDDLDVIHLPLTGAFAYMMYGIDVAENLVDLDDGQSIYKRLENVPYPSLFPSYLYFERAAATTVYNHFTVNGAPNVQPDLPNGYPYVIVKRNDMVQMTLNLLKMYYTTVDSDSEERIREMFEQYAIFFTAADIVQFRLPQQLFRPVQWGGAHANGSLIHAKAPFGHLVTKPGDMNILSKVAPVGDVTIRQYPRNQDLMLYHEIKYFEELLRIDSELLKTVVINVDTPIDPLAYYGNDRRASLIYMRYDLSDVAVNETITVEDLLRANAFLDSHDNSYTTEMLQNAAKLHNSVNGTNIRYIIMSKAKVTYKFIEDTSLKNDLIKPLDVKVAFKDTQAERVYTITEIPIYYKRILNEFASEEEMDNPFGIDGLRNSRNYGLSVYISVLYTEMASKMVNLDGRVLIDKQAFNHEFDGLNLAKSSISGNRVTSNKGMVVSLPMQIVTREQEEYEVVTQLDFRS